MIATTITVSNGIQFENHFADRGGVDLIEGKEIIRRRHLAAVATTTISSTNAATTAATAATAAATATTTTVAANITIISTDQCCFIR